MVQIPAKMNVYGKDIRKLVYGFHSIALVGGDTSPRQCSFTSVEESMVLDLVVRVVVRGEYLAEFICPRRLEGEV